MIKLKELFETEAAYSGSSFHFLEPTKIPPSKKDVLKGGEEEEQELSLIHISEPTRQSSIA